MGFYGNISNATRTQFNFDRVYPSRAAMQAVETTDGVYIGRYVLIEYDSEFSKDMYREVWIHEDGNLYFTPDAQEVSQLTIDNTSSGQIVRVEPGAGQKTQFYAIKHMNGTLFQYERIDGLDSNYTMNYNIDLKAFYEGGGGRGYDSTVWQKVYTEGTEKYVMVAELNTVVPTFDITSDAPTMSPRLPHFDADSTNVYYKLHAQPQWGLRLKSANDIETPVLNQNGAPGDIPTYIHASSDTTVYPTDHFSPWTRHEYDRISETDYKYYASEGEGGLLHWDTAEDGEIPVAVYFNNAGFDPNVITYFEDHYNIDNETAPSTYDGYNSISLAPTGFSGHQYEAHAAGVKNPQIDTQELSVMLPGIGDSIAKVWDIVYGGEFVQGENKPNRVRNRDIDWNSYDGVRMVEEDQSKNGFLTYNKGEHISTIAGCINSVHDLMGMIIEDLPSDVNYTISPEKVEDLTDEMIFFQNGSYYRKKKNYTFKELTNSDYVFNDISNELSEDTYQKDTYYIKNGETFEPDNNDQFVEGSAYYERLLLKQNLDPVITDLNQLEKYEPNKYYIKGPENSYIKATEPHVKSDEVYYTIDVKEEDRIQISDDYVADKFYNIVEIVDSEDFEIEQKQFLPSLTFKRDEEGKIEVLNGVIQYEQVNTFVPTKNFVLNRSDELDTSSTLIYYNIPEEAFVLTDVFNPIEIYEEDVLVKTIQVYPFEPGKYLYDQDEKEGNQYGYELQAQPQEGKQYFSATVTGTGSTTTSTVYNPETGQFEEIEQIIYNFSNIKEVELVDFTNHYKMDEEGKSYKVRFFYPELIDEADPTLKNWIEIVSVADLPQGYDYKNIYELDERILNQYRIDTFYVTNSFYYTPSTENLDAFRVDKKPTSTSGRTYWRLEEGRNVNIVDNIYRPNYYYFDPDKDDPNNDYILEDSLEPVQEHLPYYLNSHYYVYSDAKDLFNIGAVWNSEVKLIPHTVSLATRDYEYRLEPLIGFARTLNTIHGLILKINDLLEMENETTRDQDTLQGCINKINDIIAKFDKLVPQEFLIVDNYGRVRSSDFSTLQSTENIESVKLAQYDEDGNVVNEEFLLKDIHNDQFQQVDSTDEMRGQWITAHINGDIETPKVTIHHNFQKVTDTVSESNMNLDQDRIKAARDAQGNPIDGDNIVLYTPIVDKMGHIVGHNEETVTLPFGFKHINVANSTNVTDAPNTLEDGALTADNTQDTLSISSTNKWVKFDTSTEDHLKVGHLVKGFADSASHDTYYGLLQNEDHKDNLDNDNTFEVPCFKFDEAGHIIGARTHTVSLPENFESIKVTVNDAINQDSTAGVAKTITADSLTDELTLSEGNRWINLTGNEGEDSITFSHYVKEFSQSEDDTDFNNAGNNTFTVQEIGWDRAGHLTSSTLRTYTMPNNFKSIAVKNSGNNTTNAFGSGGTNTLIADSPIDTATLDTANRWIVLTPNADNDSVTLAHAAAGTSSTTKGDSTNQTPNFGATFKVPYIGIDQAGHVGELTDHTVTIPKPSLNTATGNIVTGLTLNDTTGAFTMTKANVGTLALTGFASGTTYSALTENDSINTAFSKLESAINALDVNDTATSGQYVSAVSQTNGKIKVTRASLTEYLDDYYAPLENNVDLATTFSYEIGAEELTDAQATIQWLFKKVADLEAKIALLEAPTV